MNKNERKREVSEGEDSSIGLFWKVKTPSAVCSKAGEHIYVIMPRLFPPHDQKVSWFLSRSYIRAQVSHDRNRIKEMTFFFHVFVSVFFLQNSKMSQIKTLAGSLVWWKAPPFYLFQPNTKHLLCSLHGHTLTCLIFQSLRAKSSAQTPQANVPFSEWSTMRMLILQNDGRKADFLLHFAPVVGRKHKTQEKAAEKMTNLTSLQTYEEVMLH